MLGRFIAVLALTASACGQVQAPGCEAIEELSPKRLAMFLRTSAYAADPRCVTVAIHRLGASRPKDSASIEVVIDLLDFEWPPRTDPKKLRIGGMEESFPAVSTLVAAGKAAVEPLIARLKSNQMTETARQNGIRAMFYIYSGDPPQAVATLKKAAKKTASQVEAVALESCASEVAKICAKTSWKSRCEAVLNESYIPKEELGETQQAGDHHQPDQEQQRPQNEESPK